MTFRIPSAERRLSQTNSSQVTGNLYQTRNIDLDEEGLIKLASPTVSVYDESKDADFNNVHSMFHGSSAYFVGDDLFRSGRMQVDDIFTNVTATETTPPSPGAEKDGVFFNGTEVVTDGSNVRYRSGTTWTTISGTPTVTTGKPSAVEIFPNQNSLLIGTGNNVARVNSSWAVAVTLTLPVDFIVQSIATNGNYAYIATRHAENGEAMMFLWTGVNTTNDGAYGIGTFGIGAIKKYQSTVAVVDSLGRLLQFNGSGFTELAALPVYFSRSNWGDASNDYAGIRNRGMVVDGDLIYLNIDVEVDDSNGRYIDNMIGNIWCYDPKVGLYQKYSYTNTEAIEGTVASASIDTTTNIMTVGSSIVQPTGSLVWYENNAVNVVNLIPDRYYYTIKLSDTTLKLAETYEDAMLGNAIDLGAVSGAGFVGLTFIAQKDYGQAICANYGSILTLTNSEYKTSQIDRIGFTGDVRASNMSTILWRYMQTLNKMRNLGYFVTPKMFSDSIKDQFPSLVLRFKPLNYGDKITVKYRIQDKLGLPVMPDTTFTDDSTVTWTNATTFTTASSPQSGPLDFSNVSVGDEVEILAGSGSGFMAHVSTISKSGFQYTVTIDQPNPFYASGDKSLVKIDSWKTLEVIDGATFSGTEKTIPVDVNGGWIQFKIVMEGVDISIYDNIITNRTFESAR